MPATTPTLSLSLPKDRPPEIIGGERLSLFFLAEKHNEVFVGLAVPFPERPLIREDDWGNWPAIKVRFIHGPTASLETSLISQAQRIDAETWWANNGKSLYISRVGDYYYYNPRPFKKVLIAL
jgi:hypothetical protein